MEGGFQLASEVLQAEGEKLRKHPRKCLARFLGWA